MKEKIQEILPKNPRKITEDIPDAYEIVVETAKIGKDARGQFFVRFPKNVSQAFGLKEGDLMEFRIKQPLKDAKAKPEIEMKLKR